MVRNVAMPLEFVISMLFEHELNSTLVCTEGVLKGRMREEEGGQAGVQ